MWLFYSPKDYSEMVEKISKSVFVISAILFYCLSFINNEFKELLDTLSFGAVYDFCGLNLNLALFYLPLLGGILEHIFKVHNLISKLCKIRKTYDRKIIVGTILKKAGIEKISKELSGDTVDSIMTHCFYKYASSTNPQIDSHYITLALNEWCWFWILLDTLCMFCPFGIYLLIAKWSLRNLALVLGVIGGIALLMFLIILVAIAYSKKEIDAIFRLNVADESESVKDKIEKELKNILQNALHN